MSANELADRLGMLDPWERVAYLLDVFRVIPRMALIGYAVILYEIGIWFMALKDPTVAQGAFISVVYGVAPLLLNFYMQQGIDWETRMAGKFERAKEGAPNVVNSPTAV